MLSTAINLPTRRSYVFENSRYNPVTGFSTRGLLPTDRKALSNRDGSDGYASLDEASEVLLSKGSCVVAVDLAVAIICFINQCFQAGFGIRSPTGT